MKIAFIIPSLSNLGPVIVVNELVRGLQQVPEVSQTDVYYLDDREDTDKLHFPCFTKKIGLFEKIDLSGYDVIHSHGIRPDMFLMMQKLRNKKLPVVSTMHCYIYPELAQTYSKTRAAIATPLWLMMLRPFNKVVFLAEAMMKHYAPFFSKSQIAFVHNYRDKEQINRGTLTDLEKEEVIKFKNGHTLIGTICKLTKRKGVYQLIELLTVEPEYKLIVVGDGIEQKNLEALAQKRGVANRCLFTGFKNNAAAYLSFMDIFCLGSNSEGFGLVLLEAALFEKSIVCTDLPSFRELFSKNEAAFFQYGNIASLQKAVRNALENNKEHAHAAYLRTLTDYNKEKFIQGYLKVYQDLISQNK